MNKKIFIIIITIVIILIMLLIRFNKFNIYNTVPVYYNGEIGQSDIETIWCGTFQIAWNELIDYLGNKVEFENYSSNLVDILNQQNFTKDMISPKDYYLKLSKGTPNLENEIISDIENKFNEKRTSIFNNFDFHNTNSLIIYSQLEKNFNFLEKFDELGERKFGNSNKVVKCFGISDKSEEKIYKNVEIMYYEYNWDISEDFAVKLKTKENEEIILFKTDKIGNFDDIYNEALKLESKYTGTREFNEHDYLLVPNINLDVIVNYDELCGKIIKNSNGMYIENAIQKIKFSLNELGGKLSSNSFLRGNTIGGPSDKSRKFNFCQPSCYMFIKEKDKEKPYFAIKINTNFLECIED